MRTWILFSGLLLLTACGSKVTQDSAGRVLTGMSQDEVEDFLGRAVICTETFSTKTCSWGTEHKSITVSFVDGKAQLISKKGL